MAEQGARFTLSLETERFNKAIEKFANKSNLSFELILKKIAFDLVNRIIKKSPV